MDALHVCLVSPNLIPFKLESCTGIVFENQIYDLLFWHFDNPSFVCIFTGLRGQTAHVHYCLKASVYFNLRILLFRYSIFPVIGL